MLPIPVPDRPRQRYMMMLTMEIPLLDCSLACPMLMTHNTPNSPPSTLPSITPLSRCLPAVAGNLKKMSMNLRQRYYYYEYGYVLYMHVRQRDMCAYCQSYVSVCYVQVRQRDLCAYMSSSRQITVPKTG